MKRLHRRRMSNRCGAVAVEFAFMAPVFLIVLVGMAQASQIYEVHNLLMTAAREGARLASMDRDGLLAQGETTNEKMDEDIRNFLNANGLPGNDVNVFISEVGDPSATFNVDDPANNLRNFQVRVELPNSALGSGSIPGLSEFNFAVELVFRNSRAPNAQ